MALVKMRMSKAMQTGVLIKPTKNHKLTLLRPRMMMIVMIVIMTMMMMMMMMMIVMMMMMMMMMMISKTNMGMTMRVLSSS